MSPPGQDAYGDVKAPPFAHRPPPAASRAEYAARVVLKAALRAFSSRAKSRAGEQAGPARPMGRQGGPGIFPAARSMRSSRASARGRPHHLRRRAGYPL